MGDIVAQIWEWVKADNPIKPKKPKRPKRVIHRELPLRDRSVADVSAQAWEWIKADNPIKPKKPKAIKAPPPPAPIASTTLETTAQSQNNSNPPRKTAKDRARKAWIWIKGDNPIKPPKAKKQRKLKSKTSRTRMAPIPNGQPKRKAKPQRQLPHHPTLPQIPEQEEAGPSTSRQVPSLDPAALDEVSGDGVHGSSGGDDQNDASSETSSINEGEPPEYRHNHSRPPSYMTVDWTGDAGVHVPGGF